MKPNQLLKMKIIVYVSVMCILFAFSKCEMTDTQVMEYLHRYGYLKNVFDISSVTKALELFQDYLQLNVTGKMDAATEALMHTPRCGHPDIVIHEGNSTSAESDPMMTRSQCGYIERVMYTNKWNSKVISYEIINITNELDISEFESTVQSSLSKWVNYVDLSIRYNEKIPGSNIRIHFYDEPCEGILGFAVPPLDGRVFIAQNRKLASQNSQENDAVLLESLVLHELGHALGLQHVNHSNAIMFPYHNRVVKLAPIDIHKIQERYFANKELLCRDRRVDTMFRNQNGEHILMLNGYYWTVTRFGVLRGPDRIQNYWPGLPDTIDAALSVGNETYFFKGRFFHISGNGRNTRLRIPIYPTFGMHLDRVDAVFPYKDSYFFFKGDLFWKINKQNPQFEQEPQYIRNFFNGIPDNINSAVSFKHRIMFVKGSEYYIYNIEKGTLYPSMPKCLYYDYFDCQK